MTKKQMRKIAQEIAELNRVYEDVSSTKKEKEKAKKRLYDITYSIICLKDGLYTLGEIDELVQKIIKN